jgi:phosphonopyruvate decarboxylase
MTESSLAKLVASEILESGRGVFGVPDSTLTELLHEFKQNPRHHVAANEGSAIGMAIGFWLQTKTPAHVYLQNSGLLNAGNPLLSLSHKSVYDIPMTLTIGWRGKPGVNGESTDEAQHRETGAKTAEIAQSLGFDVIQIETATQYLEVIRKIHVDGSSRAAILVPRGIFDSRSQQGNLYQVPNLTRKQAIEAIFNTLIGTHAFVSGTGYMSRDLASAQSQHALDSDSIFYLVGGMGHVSSVAAGISIGGRDGRIAAIEGDGGAMMHLGSIASIPVLGMDKVDLFLIRNGVHASVGGQEIVNPKFNFQEFANAAGFQNIGNVSTIEELVDRVQSLQNPNDGLTSTFTLVQVQEPAFDEPSARPSGFSEMALNFRP